MKGDRILGVVAAACVLTAGIAPAAQDAAGAAIRRELSEPFSYFRAPTDQLGFEDVPEGARSSPTTARSSAPTASCPSMPARRSRCGR